MPSCYRWAIFIVTSIVGIVWLDHATKLWALHTVQPGYPIAVMPGLQWTLAFNRGVSFGKFQMLDGWQHLFLLGIIVCITIGIAWMLFLQWKNQAHWNMVGYTMILSGALGNLWDRFAWGFVIDFIDVFYHTWHWYIFNVADSVVCIGTVCLIVALRKTEKNKLQ